MAKGMDNIVTSHPGSTQVGKALRGILKDSTYDIDPNTEALLFSADNSAYINQILRPALEEGKLVLADRNNFISSLVYQPASGCTLDELDNVHKGISNPPKIDILVILNVNWDTASRRMASRGIDKKDRFENQGREYFEKICSGYTNICKTHISRLYKFVRAVSFSNTVQPNIHFVDATRDEDEVYKDVLEILEKNIYDLRVQGNK